MSVNKMKDNKQKEGREKNKKGTVPLTHPDPNLLYLEKGRKGEKSNTRNTKSSDVGILQFGAYSGLGKHLTCERPATGQIAKSDSRVVLVARDSLGDISYLVFYYF